MDEGIRRRVVVIPFRNRLTEEQIDRHLAKKFEEELPGILSWLIQGYIYYQKEGLHVPPVVQEATSGYFIEQDVFKVFVDESYTIDPNGKLYAKNVYPDYRSWCEHNGEKPVSNIALGKELQRLGVDKHKDMHGVYYGLVLSHDNSDHTMTKI